MKSYFAVPTERTDARLRRIMQSAPITLEFEQMAVPLLLNTDVVSVETGGEYSAAVESFGHRFDEELGHSQMVATLRSPDLVKRALELGAPQDYVPLLLVQNVATPLAQSNKYWLRAIETSLVMSERGDPFTFIERVIDV